MEAVTEDLSDESTFELALEANLTRIEMRPIDSARAIKRMMELHPERTITEQAKKIHKSTAWVNKVLKISALTGAAADKVNHGEISLKNAAVLVRLQNKGVELDSEILEQAERFDAREFALRMKPLLDDASPPSAKMRTSATVEAELERARSDTNTHPAWIQALNWVLQLEVDYEVLKNEE
jgi:ParB family chromosome partitioning protein